VSRGAEEREGRPPVKGNALPLPMPWTPSRVRGMPAVLERIRQAVQRQRKDRLTALFHPMAHVVHLRAASLALQHEAALGVEGIRQTGNLQLPGLHAYLWPGSAAPIYGVTANDEEAAVEKAAGKQRGTAATPA